MSRRAWLAEIEDLDDCVAELESALDGLADMDSVPDFATNNAAYSAPAADVDALSDDDSSDGEIRRDLLAALRARHGAEPDTVVLEALGLRRRHVRADVVVVNGILHGYEIKSDRDTLRRLERQTIVYGEVFDRVTLVAGRSHFDAALAHVPA